MNDPIGVLAASVHHAVLVGLTPEQYEEMEWGPDRRGTRTGKMLTRRPRIDNVDCVMFSQTWGSTALGFGGLGGQAMTTAYTVVCFGPNDDACVYFGGRFAYHIERLNDTFRNDVQERDMHKVAGAAARYESQP